MSVEETVSPFPFCRPLFAEWKTKSVLALLAFITLSQFSVQAQNFDPFLNQPGASSVTDDGPLKVPRMYWRSGESIDGALVGADGKALSWKADLFAEPLQVRLHSLLRVEMPQPAAPAVAAPSASFSILLKSGDRLYSEIQSITPEGLILESQRHTTVKVPLSAVQAIERLRGDGLVYSGPQGVAGWKAVPGSQGQQAFTWMAGERGGLLSRSWNRAVKMELPMPDKVSFEIVLSSPLRPQFSLGFALDPNTAPVIETWQDEMVVADEGLFTPLRTLTDDDRNVALRVFWDRPGKIMRIHDWAGKLITEFHAGHNEPANMGIVLRNKGAELTLERLNVRVWDGNPCPSYEPSRGWLRQLGGATIEGTITQAVDGLAITPANSPPQTIPVSQIAGLNMGGDMAQMQAKKVPLPEMLAAVRSPESLPTRLRYADGTLLTGALVQIENNTALMRLAGLTDAITANLKDMTRLLLNEPAPLSTPPEKPLAQ
ncbi:MAG: resA 3, partial [Verrucomicrobiaceae bacterium]|nr:resA 3 [Verrucomicrobiaceae bacterium]